MPRRHMYILKLMMGTLVLIATAIPVMAQGLPVTCKQVGDKAVISTPGFSGSWMSFGSGRLSPASTETVIPNFRNAPFPLVGNKAVNPGDPQSWFKIERVTPEQKRASGCGFVQAGVLIPGSNWTPVQIANTRSQLSAQGGVLGNPATFAVVPVPAVGPATRSRVIISRKGDAITLELPPSTESSQWVVQRGQSGPIVGRPTTGIEGLHRTSTFLSAYQRFEAVVKTNRGWPVTVPLTLQGLRITGTLPADWHSFAIVARGSGQDAWLQVGPAIEQGLTQHDGVPDAFWGGRTDNSLFTVPGNNPNPGYFWTR